MSGTRLWQTTGVEEQWQAVISPWIAREAGMAWTEMRPTVILTPSRAESFYLRSRLVAEGRSFFGLRFWIPSDARLFLSGEIETGLGLASEAELLLLARVAAEKVATKSNEASLASVQRDPALFLRAYDLLLGAGWNPAKDGAPYSRKLAREFELLLKERKVTTQAGLHRLLWRAKARKKFLRSLLVCGFNAAHWPLWELLKATVAAAERTEMGLLAPRTFAEGIDELWIGSWEEETGEEIRIPASEEAERPEPFAAWVGAYERGEPVEAPEADFAFVATADLSGQIQAIVGQALAYLAQDSCTRLGVIFPEANALALGVAEELRRLGIPLDDATGHWQPGAFECRTWRTWLDLQEEPSVERLMAWVRAAEAERTGYGSAQPARKIARALENALGETLVDDLNFLGLHLEENSSGHEVGEFLRARRQLPEEAAFADFLEMTRQAIGELGWRENSALELAAPPGWLIESSWVLPRRTFLEWLRTFSDSRVRARGAESNHFYGKVHLLLYAQMPGQTWTHLILTGLNEGRWPRLSETGAFGSRYELMELNRQARALNRRSGVEGSQGSGHEAVRPDRGHCLLPLERQDLALRDLGGVVESTTGAVCFAALTSEAGRTLLPSDFFATAFQAKTGRVLDEAAFSALAKGTGERCLKNSALVNALASPVATEIPEATRIAYEARRDSTRAFGRYEFAFAQPPREPIQFACKTWEDAWNRPAVVWLEKIVGVEAWPDGQLAWPRAVGTWVHRWLAQALGGEEGDADLQDFHRRLRTASEREATRIREQMARAGAPLYPWWKYVWGKAQAISLALGESVAPHLRESLAFTEYVLPKEILVELPGAFHRDFELRGNIDLLRIEPGAAPFEITGQRLPDCSCWVIDFKTGAAKNLTNSRIEKGIGLQTMLYALAVRAMGAASVAVSLHTVDAPLKPQVQIEQVEANMALFRALDRMHRTGVFGMRPEPENDYGFAAVYPLATRPIPPAVLEAKWALVHGAAALWEGA